jgi:hypothetical protein
MEQHKTVEIKLYLHMLHGLPLISIELDTTGSAAFGSFCCSAVATS